MMLSEYNDDGSVKRIIDEILSDNDVRVSEFSKGLAIGAGLCLLRDEGLEFYIHEFPGNCSSLVISNIQNWLGTLSVESGKIGLLAVKVAIEIAEKLDYGALFASGTSIWMKEALEKECGFQPVIMGVHNPHSGNDNFFLIRII